MQRLTVVALALFSITNLFAAGQSGIGGTPTDSVFYFGGSGTTEALCSLRLSDGSILIGGSATSMEWVPKGVTARQLSGPMPGGETTDRTPFILHCSPDLKRLQSVTTLPHGSAMDVSKMATTSVGSAPTGALYISGTRKGSWKAKPRGGYFIARLNGNYIDAPPTALEWTQDISADKRLAQDQPWDVGGDGKVVYATGSPYSYDWMAVERLTSDGKPDLVPKWRTHWGTKADGSKTEFWGMAADSPHPLTHSAIVLKVWGRGDFRSWTRDDYELKVSDGNGGVNQGRWPLDAMFPGYFDAETKKTVDVTGTKQGYYGYRWGSTPCACVGAIAIDRRTNEMYIGGNNKSRLPGGNPDFEPWVVAMSADGELRWWQRLYAEAKGVSTPDQYIDELAVDYSSPRDSGRLAVVARSHGNNVNNFYNPSRLVHPDSPKRGFQDGFTGTHGNMHFSWMGKLSLEAGDVINATYLAEYGEGSKHGSNPFRQPSLAHWPHWRSGWPNLNTTKIKSNALTVGDDGRVYLCALGRRVVTTKGAYMEMPSPLANPGSKGQWAHFARVYESDLTTVSYSTILRGAWDWSTGKGGSGVDMTDCVAVPGGIIVVGKAPLSKSGTVEGDDMPTRRVPAWGSPTRSGTTGVAAFLQTSN